MKITIENLGLKKKEVFDNVDSYDINAVGNTGILTIRHDTSICEYYRLACLRKWQIIEDS